MKKLHLKQYRIRVFFTNKIKEFNKAAETDYSLEEVAGLCHFNECARQIIIAVFDDKISTLAHEVHHAIVSINAMIGAPIDKSSNEHNAYLTGYITEEFLKHNLIDITKGLK